jgi:hypothetical protein
MTPAMAPDPKPETEAAREAEAAVLARTVGESPDGGAGD